MTKKRGSSNDIFDSIAQPRNDENRGRRRSSGFLQQREGRLEELARGETESKVHRLVDPARCRMWSQHDRFYDLLNHDRCKDLIDQFLAQGRQEIPAIVRKLDNDPDHDYEIICGARRHWTVSWLRENNYPDYRFLIEVRDLTDEQAFRLSDIENRGHEDLSDYERALKYRRAIGPIYRTQAEMAERNRRSTAWVSRYLDLADLPEEVVLAYASPLDIRASHAREIKPLLRGSTGIRVKEAAKDIAAQQKSLREGGKDPIGGPQVVSLLKKAASLRAEKPRPKAIGTIKKEGKTLLSGTYERTSGWTLKVPRTAADDIEAVIEAVRVTLEAEGS